LPGFLSGLLLAPPACAGIPPGAPAPLAAPDSRGAASRGDAAVGAAIDFLAAVEPNPHLFLFMDMFHRRFGVGRFTGSLSRFDDLMRRSPPGAQFELRALRRMLDPNTPIDSGGRSVCVPTVDLLTCPALYCDRVPPPPAYPEMLREAIDRGRYILTHVGLVMIEARDLGCKGFVPSDVETAAIDGMTKLIAIDGHLTDLELEAATFLQYLGHGDRVPGGFPNEVLAAQRPGGGWPMDSAEPQEPAVWHPTALAAWYLMESRPVSGARPTMVPLR
jgi:hypothetical protein